MPPLPAPLAADEFALRDDLVYLNHATISPWPRRTAEAVQRFAAENAAEGGRHYARWTSVEEALREQLRYLINAPHTDDIALLKNTSEGLSVVAYGLAWAAGDNVVIGDEEFPSNRIVWESLRPQGVEVREARLDCEDPEAALLRHMDARTRLLSVSSVQFASGRRMDLARLGAACRERGVLFCVDAIQSLGALPLDVEAIQADFVVADAQKWLLGPEGLALFYCRAALRERLRLLQYGWHMVEAIGDFDRREWQPAHSARRFECGSPNNLGIHALHASLSLLLEVGIDEVARRVLANVGYLMEGLTALPGVELLTPTAAERRAGIVTFRHREIDSDQICQDLSAHGVIGTARSGGVRFSPHFYNTREQLDRALEWVGRCTADGAM